MSELFRRYKQTRESNGLGRSEPPPLPSSQQEQQRDSSLYPSMRSLDDSITRRRRTTVNQQSRFGNDEIDHKFTNLTSSISNNRDKLSGRSYKDVRFSDPPSIRSNHTRFDKYLESRNGRAYGIKSREEEKEEERLRSPIKSLNNGRTLKNKDYSRDRLSMYSTLGSTPIRNKYKVSKKVPDDKQSGIISRLVNYFTHHDEEQEDEDVKLLKRTARNVLDIDPVQDVLDQSYEDRIRRESRIREEQERLKLEEKLRIQQEEYRLRFEQEKILFEERKRQDEERLRNEQERFKIEKERFNSDIERLKLKDNEKILKLEKELNDYRKQLKDAKLEINSKDTEIQELHYQIDDLSEKCDSLEHSQNDKLSIMDEKQRKLLFEIKKLKDKLDAKNKENSALRSEIEEFLNLNFK